MPLEVIGAGYGRTGTMSLKLALERLGYVKCYHMAEVFGHPEHVPIWAPRTAVNRSTGKNSTKAIARASTGRHATCVANTRRCIRMQK